MEPCSPTIRGNPYRAAYSARSSKFSRCSSCCSAARFTSSFKWSRSTGFCRKSNAPSFMAATASSTDPYAVSRSTGIVASACFVSRRTSSPDAPGIFKSVITSKYLRARTFWIAAAPSGASSTEYPARSRAFRIIARSSLLSSTRRRGSISFVFITNPQVFREQRNKRVRRREA